MWCQAALSRACSVAAGMSLKRALSILWKSRLSPCHSFGIHTSSSHLSGVFGCSWYVSHKSPMYLLREPYISVKRALFVSQKSPTYLSKEPYLCQKSPSSLAHLVSMYHVSSTPLWALSIFQKSPTYLSKSPICLSKEPCLSLKTALHICQESSICVTRALYL